MQKEGLTTKFIRAGLGFILLTTTPGCIPTDLVNGEPVTPTSHSLSVEDIKNIKTAAEEGEKVSVDGYLRRCIESKDPLQGVCEICSKDNCVYVKFGKHTSINLTSPLAKEDRQKGSFGLRTIQRRTKEYCIKREMYTLKLTMRKDSNYVRSIDCKN